MEDTRAILWDNDGILVDTEPLYYEANREVLAELGISLGHEEYRATDRQQAMQVALRLRRNDRYAELIKERAGLFPGVRQTLEALAGRVRMAIVTSSNPDHFDLIHSRLGILHFFEFVLTGKDFARFKPHPDPYLLAAERMELQPADCLVVEDSARGLASAVAAGIPCAVIPHSLSAGADFSTASAVLDHIGQVPDLLSRKNDAALI